MGRLVAICALLLAAPSAGAAERVAVLTVGDEALDADLRTALARLPKDRRVVVVSEARVARLLAPDVSIDPVLRPARKHLRRAEKRFQSFELDGAQRSIKRATRALEPWRGRPETVAIEQAILALGVSIAHARRDEAQVQWSLATYAQRFDAAPESGWPPALAERLGTLVAGRDAAIRVRTEPAAEVFVDGRSAGRSPTAMAQLAAGAHRILVRAPGYAEADRRVTVKAGSVADVEITLQPDLTAGLAAVEAGAPVDSALVDLIRARAAASDVDSVVLAVVRDAKVTVYRVWSGPPGAVTIRRGADLSVALEHLHAPPAVNATDDQQVWSMVGGIGGLAAVGAGVALRVLAAERRAELDARAGAITQVDAYALRDAGEGEAMGGAILLGVGVAAVATVTGWLIYEALGGTE